MNTIKIVSNPNSGLYLKGHIPFSGSSYYRNGDRGFDNFYYIKTNVISHCVSTINAILSINDLRVSFYGSNANENESRNLIAYNAFLDSFIENKFIKDRYSEAVLSSLVYGVGVLKVTCLGVLNIDPCNIDVLENEIFDENFTYVKESYNSTFRNLLKYFNFLSSNGYEYDTEYSIEEIYDTIDGTFTLSINNEIVYSKKFSSSLPYSFLIWNKSYNTKLPFGIVDELLPYQMQIEDLIKKINNVIEIVSKPVVFADTNNPSEANAINNLFSKDNIPMQIVNTPMGKPIEYGIKYNGLTDMINLLDYLIDKAYMHIGLNKSMIDGSIPSKQLRSANALNEAYNQRNSRFSFQNTKYMNCVKKLFVSLVTILKEKNFLYNHFNSNYGISNIDFKILYKGINTNFHIVIGQTSDYQTDITGRINMVSQLVASGFKPLDLLPILENADLNLNVSHLTLSYKRVNTFLDRYIADDNAGELSSDMDLNYLLNQIIVYRSKYYISKEYDIYLKLEDLLTKTTDLISSLSAVPDSGDGVSQMPDVTEASDNADTGDQPDVANVLKNMLG